MDYNPFAAGVVVLAVVVGAPVVVAIHVPAAVVVAPAAPAALPPGPVAGQGTRIRPRRARAQACVQTPLVEAERTALLPRAQCRPQFLRGCTDSNITLRQR
jgi:hypothetical protein